MLLELPIPSSKTAVAQLQKKKETTHALAHYQTSGEFWNRNKISRMQLQGQGCDLGDQIFNGTRREVLLLGFLRPLPGLL